MLRLPSFWFKISPALFFAAFLLIGLLIYKDYGISFDEFWEWETGLTTLKYLVEVFAPHLLSEVAWLKTIRPLETYPDYDHGITVALPMVVLKSLLGIETWEGTFFFRHLFNFLIFYVGVVFFYLLTYAHFKSRAWALLGCLMLILSPRLFADAFYNSKDLPFLSFCIIAAYTLVRFLEKPTYGRAAGHAFACALAIDTRMMGVLLPAVTGLMLLIQVIRDKKQLAPLVRPLALYLVLLVAFVIAIWPYLWADPLHRFINIFENMRHFRWPGTNLYFGKFIPASQLPWHYIPAWILITTPFSYTLFFLAGLGTLLFRLKKPKEADWQLYLYPAFLFGALAAVVFLNAVLYDGWRHMFFVYFAFLMISLVGVRELWYNDRLIRRRQFRQLLVVLVLGGNLLSTCWFMVKNHPYQNVYFSLFPASRAEKTFERDYWGLSYRQGLEFLLQYDKSNVITYAARDVPGYSAIWILPEKGRKRLRPLPQEDMKQATYFLTNYRWHPQPYPYKEIYSIQVEGLKIMTVFKLK